VVFKATSPETARVELSTPAATENVRLKIQETLEKHFADARQFTSTHCHDAAALRVAHCVAAQLANQFKPSTQIIRHSRRIS